MGRIYEPIVVRGVPRNCLFDSGARNTYITAEVAKRLPRWKISPAYRSGLGGRVRRITQASALVGTLRGHQLDTEAYIVRDLGRDEKGRPIEIIFGALAMQKWCIELIPKDERLDMSHFPKEFVEF